MKAPFIPHETPWGDFSTYELPIDIKIHKLYLKTPTNLNKLKKNKTNFTWGFEVAIHMS